MNGEEFVKNSKYNTNSDIKIDSLSLNERERERKKNVESIQNKANYYVRKQ